jgi:tricorn protease
VLTVNEPPTPTAPARCSSRRWRRGPSCASARGSRPTAARVDEATGGRVGYIYVQSTGVDAQNELVRQFMAQWRKDGLIIDERFNSGGQIPDRFIELLEPPDARLLGVRDGAELAVAAGGPPRPAR